MIDYEKELEKFQPMKSVDQVEEAILSENLTDMTDLLQEILKEKDEK